MTPDALTSFLAADGLWLMAPLAVVEGPVVTIIGGALAAKGTLNLWGVLAVAVIADLVGDAALWIAGRYLNDFLPSRLHKSLSRTLPPATLRRKAGRILVFGKLTHSIGAAVLVAAGMARVPFVTFLFWNLLATLPKVAVLAGIGWVFGQSLGPDWLGPAATGLMVAGLLGAVWWLRKQGRKSCASLV